MLKKNYTVNIEPDDGYYIKSVTVDGQPVPHNGNKFTVKPSELDKIEVDSQPYKNVILARPDSKVIGKLTHLKTGDTVTLFVRPQKGYALDVIVVNNEEVHPKNGIVRFTVGDNDPTVIIACDEIEEIVQQKKAKEHKIVGAVLLTAATVSLVGVGMLLANNKKAD
jgi:FtsP/CotA-like multicopper oxidase with cupredoxin domain